MGHCGGSCGCEVLQIWSMRGAASLANTTSTTNTTSTSKTTSVYFTQKTLFRPCVSTVGPGCRWNNIYGAKAVWNHVVKSLSRDVFWCPKGPIWSMLLDFRIFLYLSISFYIFQYLFISFYIFLYVSISFYRKRRVARFNLRISHDQLPGFHHMDAVRQHRWTLRTHKRLGMRRFRRIGIDIIWIYLGMVRWC